MRDPQRFEIFALLQESELLQDIFDSIQDGLLVIDRDKRISYANNSAEMILGLSRDELIGRLAEAIPLTMHYSGGEEIPRGSRPFAVAFSEYPVGSAQPIILKRRDGSTLPVLFNIQSTGETLTVAILTDSSELMRRQTQTDEYYQLLAHDLRNPLGIILGHAELLQQAPRSPESMGRSLTAIRKAGEQLAEMTKEMSDRLTLESGHFELKKEMVRVDELIRETVSLITSTENRHHIDLQLTPLPQVAADVYRLTRVLTNLITNAMKYSPEDSTITVSTWENSKGVITKVSDQGRGIDSEDLNYIFDPFYITSIGKEKDSVGLGLYISRLIVEAHNGRIYVSSTEEGTSFAIFLPKTSDSLSPRREDRPPDA